MASVRERIGRRGERTYSVLFRHDGKQRSRTFAERSSAEEFAEMIRRMGPEAAERLLGITSDPARSPGAPTVTDLLTRHIDALSGVQADTVRTYRTMVDQVAATPLGHLPVDAVTRDDVAAWIRTQEASGAASKTIRNRHALLSAAFTRAVEDGTAASNPARRARIARTVRREMTFLTPAEFELVLQRATPHYRPLLLTLFGTGLRLGEATALQVGDLHLDDAPPTLTVARAWKNGGVVGPPKTARGRRTIALPMEVADALRAIAGDRAPRELVFVNMGGRRVQQATLHDLWQTWIDDTEWDPRTRARVPRSPALRKKPRIHDLRHSHAAYMISRGVNLYDLRHRLGHESIQTTADVYGHLLPESQIQAARAASWSSLAPSAPAPESSRLPR